MLAVLLKQPIYTYWNFLPLSIERIHIEFMVCWVTIYNFIQILKIRYVGKQCRT